MEASQSISSLTEAQPMQQPPTVATSAIDFHTQLRQEQARSQQTLVLKLANSQQVYNFLQDMRHLVILDFRSNELFNQSRIRKSLRVDLDNFGDVLLNVFKDKQCASQYEGDDLKRILFVFPTDSWRKFEQEVNKQLVELDQKVFAMTSGFMNIHKAYFLKEFDTVFSGKYPYLTVPQASEPLEVLAESRFPSELKKDLLYLGNMTNVMNKNLTHLTLLKIQNIVYIGPKKFDDLHENSQFDTHWIQLDPKEKPLIDFDSMSTLLQDLVKKGPTFMFCPNGMLSGALAIKWAMDSNKVFTKEIATAFVTQRRYEIMGIESWLYGQIMPFGQKVSMGGLKLSEDNEQDLEQLKQMIQLNQSNKIQSF